MDRPDYMKDTVRERIVSGALARGPGRISEGSSSKDRLCDGCEHPIFAFHHQTEVELAMPAAEAQRLSMHRECYLAWLDFSKTLPDPA
jgi:hypothetical protein